MHRGERADSVQLLGHRGASGSGLEVQLGQVLLHQRDSDVLRAHVRWVLWPGDLAQGHEASRLLLLNPEHVHLHVPELPQTLPLDDPDRGAGVHPDAEPEVVYPEIAEESEDPEPLSRCSNHGVKFGLAGRLGDDRLRLRVRADQMPSDRDRSSGGGFS